MKGLDEFLMIEETTAQEKMMNNIYQFGGPAGVG